MNRDELLERALSLFDEGDWEAGAELLRDRLPDFAEEPAVHCWLGVAERELGMDGLAYERFKRALALEPADPYVLATAGSGIARFDDEDAERALRAAALTAPELPLARMLYGAYLAREGLHEEALRELRAARELGDGDPQVAYELGAGYALAGDFDRACDALADAVRFGPEDGWVRVVFGLALLEAERTEEALGELMAGAERLPDDLEAQLAAALAAAATGRDGVAYEMLERGRMSATGEDVESIDAVEDRVETGPEAAHELLIDDLVPRMLRTRLRERP